METVHQETGTHLLVADEVWCALAMLQKNHPQSVSFSAREILDQVKGEHAHGEIRAGVQAHIYLHNVANLDPNSARYRMSYKLENDTYRLYRPGDPAHPLRKGKMAPKRAELPGKYHYLLDWYEHEYCKKEGAAGTQPIQDLILRMWGLGKEIWQGVDVDEYVRSLRADWDEPDKQESKPKSA